MTTSPDLGIPFIDQQQAQPEVTHNEALLLLQALTNGVIDRGVDTPAVGPTIGDSYIIGAAPTGAWAGRANCVTIWSGTAWDFIPGETSAGTPITMGVRQEGMRAWVRDEDALYVWSGSAWTLFATAVADNSVTNAKLADMATQTIKGRTTAGTGDPEDLTAAQVRTLINVANGATALPAVATFTGNKTLALADINTYNVSQDGTTQTVTIPAQATVVWTTDAEIHIEQGAAGAVTVTGATGVSVNGVSAGSVSLANPRSVVTLKRTASDTWTVVGGLANSLVSGPATAGNGNLALFDGTTGKLIKDGGVVTAAGLALLDDASASAQRTTLGVGTGDSPTFTALTLTNGQIAFPATQVPSDNANTLDDYEEGTWTPTLTFDTPGDLSVVYSVRSGVYTKVGRVVAITFLVRTSTFTHTTASSVLRITGVPFAGVSIGIGASNWRGVTKAGYTDVVSRIDDSNTNFYFMISGSGQATTSITASDMPSGGSVELFSSSTYNTST